RRPHDQSCGSAEFRSRDPLLIRANGKEGRAAALALLRHAACNRYAADSKIHLKLHRKRLSALHSHPCGLL
ncbi:MAG: hypothetical protein IRA32_19485, partial [Xanthomonas citri pv. citri]